MSSKKVNEKSQETKEIAMDMRRDGWKVVYVSGTCCIQFAENDGSTTLKKTLNQLASVKIETEIVPLDPRKKDIGLVLDLELTNEMESPENPPLHEQGSPNDAVPQQTSTPYTDGYLNRNRR
ncbi:hypothetical protein CEXT_408891 [Caerostris extrusa]|uniref:Uncharacterized protein n=1 Tax=Caerostris extrusa TaxID=172846 RepID=A0AAV4R0C8_CAEEX|nr:hypothetical protein CEXT_408891 [Caerostris extrusa]